MLRVNEYVNTVQNDTSNGWDDGATDDGSSSQPEPGSYASTWDMLIAGDIDGLYEKASDNPISRSDLWKNDIKPGIVDPFITGASQAVNEWSRAQQQETDAFKDMIDNIATGADQDAVNSSINNYNDASQYATDAGKLVMKGPLALIPSIGAGTFVGDAINKGIEDENPFAAIRAATYGPAVDYASQDNLMDKIIERPVTTLGEGAMSVLPLIGAGYVGYKGGKAVKGRYNESIQTLDDMGGNYVHSNDGVTDDGRNGYTNQTPQSEPEPQPEPQDYTQGQPAAEPAEQPPFSTGVDSNVDAMVANAAAKYQVDPALLAKLVDQESTYGRNPDAGGNLAQISDDLARQYGLDSSDPAQSIEGGARYLKEQLDNNNGDVREALAAYNGGPGAPNYNYADQVLARDIGGEMGKSYSGGNGGEGAYEAGADAWMGAPMPHGSEGCVEAATRVGSFYDGFLKDEAEKGVTSVPTLIADAGERFIPFDEKSLEKGDVIVYDGDEHVVTYDGNGGYVGNSTSQGRIVHGSDYHEMGGMEPTGIIKASDNSGGGDGYSPETSSGDDAPTTDNGDVDVFGNKLNEEPADEQPQTEQPKESEDAAKPIDNAGKPADVDWGDDEPVTLYSGEQGNLENGRHLSRERNVLEKGLPTKPQQDNIPPERVQEVKNLDSYMGALQAERQRMIDEEVNFYKDTPGGKGTQTGTVVDDTGRVTGRFSESYNPQWYQDAYKYFKGKPPKSRLPEFAEDYLSKNSEEFNKIDLQIRQLQEYRDRITKQPTADSDTTAKQVLSDIQDSRAPEKGADIDRIVNDNLPGDGVKRSAERTENTNTMSQHDIRYEKETAGTEPQETPSKHSRGPARFVEEQPEKRGFIANDVIPTARGAVEFAKKAKDEIQRVIAPSTMGKDSKLTAQNMREFLSDMAHKGNTLEHALGDVQKYFEKHPEQSIPFISKMEHGERMSDPKLQAFADSMRKIMDARAKEVRDLGTGKLEHFIKNYFPHIWKDEEKAGSFSAAWLGKRPFEGKKSFLKKRTVPTITEGIKAGLEPITRNPADLVIMKMREMDKYIMAHKTIEAERKAGRGKWVRDVQGQEAPDGWTKVDDKIAVKYGPPVVDVREAYDPAIMDTLNHVCDTLNIKHTRDTVLKAGGKRVDAGTWGYASSDGKIGTKFGGPESVLAHEIGHQLDYKYHLYDIMRSDPTKLRIGNSNKYTTAGKEMQREFEILADKRMDPNDMNNAHRQYVQGGTEPMAAVIEAYVHAPEMLKETAPVIYKTLMKFFKAHPELNDLRDIKPSLRLKENRGEQPINGLVTLGHFYMPADSARLINNYLAPGLRDKSSIFREYLGIANVLNQFQLGLSAFHLGFTSMDSIVSKAALSIIKASHGDIFSALTNMLHAPIAPVENAMRGNKLYKEWMSPGSQGAKEGKLLDSLIAGGGRVKMDKMYQTNMVDTMRKAFRQGNYVGASARIPFALMEMSVKPILEFVVPREKLGIFADAMQYELKRKPDMTHEELQDVAGRIWNSVDNRLGQLCYDNLFWQKTLKDVLMASTRSVGWNLGTWRELGGAAFDAGKYVGKALKNRSISSDKTGGITHRMSYAIALPVMVGMFGAIVQYLYTGQGPNDMKDLFYPRTGTLDKNGRPQRIELPSYMKDLASYYDHPGRTLENKLHPMLSTIADMLHNKDYYGKEIYHKDDDAGKKAIDIMSYLAQQFVPFSVRGSKYNADLGGSFLSKALPFFGITPAPADVNKTEVEKKMSDIMAERRPVGSRTQEQADKADLRSTILRDLQTSNGTDRTSLNNAYMNKQIDEAEKTRLLNEYKLSPLQRQASNLGPDEIKNLMKDATSEERPVLEGIYNKKLKNQQKRQ